MLKSCSKCGRVHEHNYQCVKNMGVYRKKGESQADKYRNTAEWKRTRNDIVVRDKAMCQVCIRNMYKYTSKIYNIGRIEVHHIIKLLGDYSRRSDRDNLITLCVHHHKMADSGEITVEELQEIVKEQNRKC